LPLVCTLNATKVTEAVARLLGVDLPTLDALAGDAPAGAGGVVLVPYLDGERTPNRPHATGSMLGLRSDVSREQLARAAYEGVVCGLLDGLDALAACDVDVGGRLLLVGGGARSQRYRHVLADLTGRSVIVPSTAEVVAAGACVQAAAVLQGARPDEVAAGWGLGTGIVVEPDERVDHDAIRAAYAAARG
jgi:xylulokinase